MLRQNAISVHLATEEYECLIQRVAAFERVELVTGHGAFSYQLITVVESIPSRCLQPDSGAAKMVTSQNPSNSVSAPS